MGSTGDKTQKAKSPGQVRLPCRRPECRRSTVHAGPERRAPKRPVRQGGSFGAFGISRPGASLALPPHQHEFASGAHPELGVGARRVMVDRFRRQEDRLGDLCVRQPLHGQPRHLVLLGRELTGGVSSPASIARPGQLLLSDPLQPACPGRFEDLQGAVDGLPGHAAPTRAAQPELSSCAPCSWQLYAKPTHASGASVGTRSASSAASTNRARASANRPRCQSVSAWEMASVW